MLLLPCPECCDERTFIQPLCEDDHGVDCPELLCIDCGYGMLLGTYPEFEARPGTLPTPAVAFATRAAA